MTITMMSSLRVIVVEQYLIKILSCVQIGYS